MSTYKKLQLPCYHKAHMGPTPKNRKEKKDKDKYENKAYFRNQCGCFKKCQGKFLELKSEGTREYRKINGNDFKGCTNIEKTLKEQDLIILKDITEDNFNVEGISYLEAYGPSCDNDLIHFVLEMNQREGLMLNTEGFIRDFSLMRGAYPEDYKLFVLRKLINQKYFDDTRHLVAIIIDLGLNTQKALFEYFPGMNYASFCRYQEEIYKVIDEHTPERIKIMKEAMATLKEKQWNALKAYYITHNKKMSMEKLAHKMGISKETFRDRLNGAKKKIKKYFESKNKETEICFDLLWQDGSQESYNELMA